MQTVFPTATGYTGFFVIGFRKDPTALPAQTQRVGAAILKRTYGIQFEGASRLNGTLAPATVPFPVFDQDQPDMEEQVGNLVTNGDFETVENGNLAAWQPQTGLTLSQVEDPDRAGNHLMKVTGVANQRITQPIHFPAPVGGHKFALLFTARADAATRTTVQLEAGGAILCRINETLGTTMKTYVARGRWPNALTATSIVVVLQSADSVGRTLFYDDIGVFSLIRYEHDLVPFKPEGDIVVLDFVSLVGLCELQVNGAARLRRTLAGGGFELFGWASRSQDDPAVTSSRKDQVGTFSADPNAYPPEWPPSIPSKDPLPSDFDNRFYNGYDRAALMAANLSQLPYLEAAELIHIVRPGPSDDYSFSLGNETITAHYEFYSGIGPDQESRWQRRTVTMQHDTLVIEPGNNRCYTVWRGVWDFDDHPEGSYRRLVVTATG